MSEVCHICARVRDAETGLLTNKPSALHKSLLDLGKQCVAFVRAKANDLICLAQTKAFKLHYASLLVLDENNEPKIVSLWEVTSNKEMSDVSKEDLRNFLAKKFEEGDYKYEEALDHVKKFNEAKEGSLTFMGTIVYDNDTKSFRFKIVDNTIENQRALALLIKDVELQNLILLKLESLGIGIDTMGSDSVDLNRGVYNTINPKRLANGLLGVIALKDPLFDFDTLCNEVGHFIVGAMGDSELIKRLINIVNNENNRTIISHLLGQDEFNRIAIGRSADVSVDIINRELVGHLIGKYLKDEAAFDERPSWKKLISRVWEAAKTRFNLVTKGYFLTAQRRADFLARQAVKKFMTTSYKIDSTLSNELRSDNSMVNRALKTKEILYTGDFGVKSILGDVVTLLEQLAKFLDSVGDYDSSSQLSKDVNSLQGEYLSLEEMSISAGAAVAILNRAMTVILDLVSTVSDNIGYFASDSVIDRLDWLIVSALVLKYHKLQTLASNILKSSDLELVKDSLTTEISAAGALTETAAEATRQLEILESNLKILGQRLALDSAISLLEDKLCKSFCMEVVGSDSFFIPQYRKWRSTQEEQLIQIQDYLKLANIGEGGYMSRWIYSMGSSPDYINLIAAIATATAKHHANQRTEILLRKILKLYDRFLSSLSIFTAANTNTEKLLEHFSDGSLTSYILSKSHRGKWERAKQEYRKDATEAFLEENLISDTNPKGTFKTKLEALHSKKFLDYIKGVMRTFHTNNSVLEEVRDSKGNIVIDPFSGEPKKHWVPYNSLEHEDVDGDSKVDYYNEKYYDLSPRERSILDELVALKKELDELIPPKARNEFMVPLYRKNYLGAVMSTLGRKQVLSAGSILLNRSYLGSLLNISSEADTRYGGDYNDAEENLFGTAQLNSLASIHTVPLYGTKKLKNLNNMCTDPFAALLMHGAMAYSFDALHEVAVSLEVSKHTLDNRNVNSNTPTKDELSGKGAGFKNQLLDFLNSKIYSLSKFLLNSTYENKLQLAASIVLYKAAAGWSRMTSLFLLGGNVTSAYINLGTAIAQMIKLSISGEYYDLGDFLKAFGNYAIYLCLSAAGVIWDPMMHGISFLQNVFDEDDWHEHRRAKVYKKTGGSIENISKVALIIKYFNVDNSMNWKDFQFSRTAHYFFSHLSYTNIVMAPYSLTNHFIMGMSYLAAMHHLKVLRVNTDTGKEDLVSLWEALKAEGDTLLLDKSDVYDYYIKDKNASNVNRLKNKKSGAPKGSSLFLEEEVWLPLSLRSNAETGEHEGMGVGRDAMAIVRELILGVNDRLHVYAYEHEGAFFNHWIAPLVTTLKKYSIGLIQDRFMESRYSLTDLDVVEGSYRTFAKIMADTFTCKSNKQRGIIVNVGLNALNAVLMLTISAPLLFMPANLIGFIDRKLANSKGALWRKLSLLHRLSEMGYSLALITNYYKCISDYSMMTLLSKIANMFAPDLPPDLPDDELDELSDGKYVDYIESLYGIERLHRYIDDYTEEDWQEVTKKVKEIRAERAAQQQNEDENSLFSYLKDAVSALSPSNLKDVNPAKIRKSSEEPLSPEAKDILKWLTFGAVGGIDTLNNDAINMTNKIISHLPGMHDDLLLGWLEGYSDKGGPYSEIEDPDTGEITLKLNVKETPFSASAIIYYFAYATWAEQASLGNPISAAALPLTAFRDLGKDGNDEYSGDKLGTSTIYQTIAEWLGIGEVLPNMAMVVTTLLMCDFLSRLPEMDENGYTTEAPNALNSYYIKSGNYLGVARWRYLLGRYTPFLRSALTLEYGYSSAAGRQYGKLKNLNVNPKSR